MDNQNKLDSSTFSVKESIQTTYQIDKKIVTVESYFNSGACLSDILFEIAKKRLGLI